MVVYYGDFETEEREGPPRADRGGMGDHEGGVGLS